MSKNKNYEPGEKDGAQNKYNKPHGTISDLLTWDRSGMEQNRKDNEAYDKGWKNGYKNRSSKK